MTLTIVPRRDNRETLYAFLERREREILGITTAMRSEITALENELAHIQSAKRQIGNLGAEDNARFGMPAVDLGSVADALAQKNSNAEIAPPNALAMALGTPPTETIKDLVLKALFTNFQEHGATPATLRQFIRDAYGRDIDRTSLNPQIARLRAEGLLKQKGGEDNWRLTNEGLERATRLVSPLGSLYGVTPEQNRAKKHYE
jgi:hypothetical protein